MRPTPRCEAADEQPIEASVAPEVLAERIYFLCLLLSKTDLSLRAAILLCGGLYEGLHERLIYTVTFLRCLRSASRSSWSATRSVKWSFLTGWIRL